MNWDLIRPTEKLQPFVKYYWTMDDEKCAVCDERIRLVPTGLIELRFNFGDRYLNFRPDQSPELEPRSYLSGQTKDFYDISPTGKAGIFSVMFSPVGAAMFFSVPMSELCGGNYSADEVIGKNFRDVEEKLFETECNSERVVIVETFLLKEIKKNYREDHLRIVTTIEMIEKSVSVPQISILADTACWSEKQFTRKFKEMVGCNPKQFIRVVRFQKALYFKEMNQQESMSDLAYSCGYYDQAHFINEFKLMTGYTPKDYFKSNEAHSDYFQR
jgi:AraC-like DNA-binding protein